MHQSTLIDQGSATCFIPKHRTCFESGTSSTRMWSKQTSGPRSRLIWWNDRLDQGLTSEWDLKIQNSWGRLRQTSMFLKLEDASVFFCAHASSGYIDMRLWWQGWVLAFSHVSHFRKLQIAYPFLFATLRHGSHGISSGFQSISCYGFEDFSQLNYILYYNNGDIVQDFVTLSKDLWGFRDNIGVYGQSFHGLHMPTWYCFCLNPHAVLLPTILMSFAAVSSLP